MTSTLTPLAQPVPSVDVGPGVAIVATAATLTAAGLLARCELWNGVVLDTSTLALDDATVRTAYAQRLAQHATPDAIAHALLELASATNQALASAAPKEAKDSQATKLVALASASMDLWHAPDGRAYATITRDGHREHWRLSAGAVRSYLRRQYHATYGTAPGGQAVADALAVLDGQAQFDGPEHTPAVRLAQDGGTTYLDLGDWRAVAIDATGWRIVTGPPVYFLRAAGSQALPEPVRGGGVNLLRQYVHTATDGDYRLVVAWLLACLRPTGPYPVLCLYGEQGSGKSTLARMLASLVDPSAAGLRTPPKDAHNVAIAASHGWLVAYDNLSTLPVWLSDLLCCLATGAAYAMRTLYTDDEETLFAARRPVLINGIDEVAERDDLLDRAITVTLPVMAASDRQPEAELWASWEHDRPAILGALLDVVAAGLAALPTLRVARLPRMADFAVWAAATAPACGWDADTVLSDYAGNRAGSRATALDAVAWLPLLLALRTPWTGTASELLALINDGATDKQTRAKDWPQSGRTVSAALRRLGPALRLTGLHVAFDRAGKRGTRIITLEKIAETSSAASASSATDQPPDEDGAKQADDRLTHTVMADAPSSAYRQPNTRGADATDDADAPSAPSSNGYTNPRPTWPCRRCGSRTWRDWHTPAGLNWRCAACHPS